MRRAWGNVFREPWAETVALLAYTGWGAAVGQFSPFVMFALVAWILGRLAWSNRRSSAAPTGFVVWGRWTWLAAPGAAFVFGVALWPFADEYASADARAWVVALVDAGLAVATFLVGLLCLVSAVHGVMFRWRAQGVEAEVRVVRHRWALGRFALRWFGTGIAALCWSATSLALTYGFQFGGLTFVYYGVPYTFAGTLVGVGLWLLADRIPDTMGKRRNYVIVDDPA